MRPDSGDPPLVVCKVLELLGEAFGTTTNSKGYRVLNPHIRVIQGDAVDYAMLGRILEAAKSKGWSADNLTFGSGGGLLQKLNRDTLKFAFKCSSVTVRGQERDVYKQPVTDDGKRSKAGRLKLIREGDRFVTVPAGVPGDDHLQEVFRDGRLSRRQNFDDIRSRADVLQV